MNFQTDKQKKVQVEFNFPAKNIGVHCVKEDVAAQLDAKELARIEETAAAERRRLKEEKLTEFRKSIATNAKKLMAEQKENQVLAEKQAAKGAKVVNSQALHAKRPIPTRPSQVVQPSEPVPVLKMKEPSPARQTKSGKKVTFQVADSAPGAQTFGESSRQVVCESGAFPGFSQQVSVISDAKSFAATDGKSGAVIVVPLVKPMREELLNDPRRDFVLKKLKLVSMNEMGGTDERQGKLRNKLSALN